MRGQRGGRRMQHHGQRLNIHVTHGNGARHKRSVGGVLIAIIVRVAEAKSAFQTFFRHANVGLRVDGRRIVAAEHGDLERRDGGSAQAVTGGVAEGFRRQ